MTGYKISLKASGATSPHICLLGDSLVMSCHPGTSTHRHMVQGLMECAFAHSVFYKKCLWRCWNNMLVFFLVYRIDVIQKGFFPARIANTLSCEYLYALCSANCCQGWFYRFSHFLIRSWGPEGRRLPWWWWCSAVRGQDSRTTLNITTWCYYLGEHCRGPVVN